MERQQLGEPIDAMPIDAREHIAQVSVRLDVVQTRGLDQAEGNGCGVATALGAGEQPVLSRDRESPDILPISVKKSSCSIGGIRCMDERYGGSTASNVRTEHSFTSRCLPETSS